MYLLALIIILLSAHIFVLSGDGCSQHQAHVVCTATGSIAYQAIVMYGLFQTQHPDKMFEDNIALTS